MPSPIYLDLFDDGIPPPGANPLSNGENPFVERVADTLRFQLLLAVLFERPVVVPAAWAASSPMFLAVAGGFAAAIPARIQRKAMAGMVPSRPFVPFSFAFGDEAPSGATAQRLVTSLAWRLRQNKRLMFSSAFSKSGALAASDEGALRSQLADKLTACLGRDEDLAAAVPREIEQALRGVGEGTVTERAAMAFGNVLELMQWPDVSIAQTFSKARYDSHMAGAVARIRDAALAVEKEDPRGFSSFFSQAEGHDLMALWQQLGQVDIPDADKLALEAFGRSALSQAYAATVGARDLSAVSFDAYSRERTRPIDKAVLVRSLALGSVPGKAPALGTDFVSLAAEKGHDPVESVDWNAVWEAAAHLATSKTWRAGRERLIDKLRPLAPADLDRADPWQELFDRINAELHGQIALLGNTGRRKDLVSLVGKVLGHVETAAKLAGAGLAVTIPLTALKFLAGIAGEKNLAYEKSKAIRRYRRLLLSPTAQAVSAMLARVA